MSCINGDEKLKDEDNGIRTALELIRSMRALIGLNFDLINRKIPNFNVCRQLNLSAANQDDSFTFIVH